MGGGPGDPPGEKNPQLGWVTDPRISH
jgi:hypothetical protein